jgi:hypothetical protein
MEGRLASSTARYTIYIVVFVHECQEISDLARSKVRRPVQCLGIAVQGGGEPAASVASPTLVMSNCCRISNTLIMFW